MKKEPSKSSEKTPLLISATTTLIIPRTNGSDNLRQPYVMTQQIENTSEYQPCLGEGSNKKKKTCLIS